MCGIIGVTGNGPVVPRLIDSLKRLEYRGYDSAGVAAVVDGSVERRRAKGKIRNLEAVLAADPLKRPRATFGRVALGCIAAYLALAYLPSMPGDLLPHQWFAAWWAPEENSVYSVTTLLKRDASPSAFATTRAA